MRLVAREAWLDDGTELEWRGRWWSEPAKRMPRPGETDFLRWLWVLIRSLWSRFRRFWGVRWPDEEGESSLAWADGSDAAGGTAPEDLSLNRRETVVVAVA